MNGPARLAVRGLTKRFGGLVAVDDLSFAVRTGEILGLIGPNGSGKSTVMKLIMGIERPNAGTVQLDGVDISRWPSHRIARAGIGIVFQRSRPLRRQTVLENIKLALLPDSLWQLVADPSVDPQARCIAERVGLGAVMNRNPSTLSFADLRRLEMAKAIARHPKVVLLDEPFAGIDPIAVGDIQQLVRHLTERGIGVLITDHNVRETLSLIDRAYIIYDGQVLTQGKPSEIISNEDVRRVYLGDMFVNKR